MVGPSFRISNAKEHDTLKILIAGYFLAFWHEDAWGLALRELGHEIVEFRMAPYVRGGLARQLQNRFLVGPAINSINRDFAACVRESRPDVVLCYRALPLWPDLLRKLAEEGRWVLASYNNDNIFGPLKHKAYWRYFRRAIPYYDLHLVYREADIAHYSAPPKPAVYMLKSHYLPWLHRNLVGGPESDICFLGHCEGDGRLELLDCLMRQVPARYQVRGSRWQELGKGRAWEGMDTGEVQGEEYVRRLSGAKFALVFFSGLNLDHYTRRVFEIPACGTFMLSQRTETMQTLYEEDQEAVYFDNVDELVDKARFYLQNNTVRQRIAQAGYQRCLRSGYDIYSRMREWTALAQQLLATKASL